MVGSPGRAGGETAEPPLADGLSGDGGVTEFFFILFSTLGVLAVLACAFSAGWLSAALWSRRFIRLPDDLPPLSDDPFPASLPSIEEYES